MGLFDAAPSQQAVATLLVGPAVLAGFRSRVREPQTQSVRNFRIILISTAQKAGQRPFVIVHSAMQRDSQVNAAQSCHLEQQI